MTSIWKHKRKKNRSKKGKINYLLNANIQHIFYADSEQGEQTGERQRLWLEAPSALFQAAAWNFKVCFWISDPEWKALFIKFFFPPVDFWIKKKKSLRRKRPPSLFHICVILSSLVPPLFAFILSQPAGKWQITLLLCLITLCDFLWKVLLYAETRLNTTTVS